MRHRVALVALVAAISWLANVQTGAQPAPLRVFSSNGVKAAIEQLTPQSEKLVGRPLAITFGTSNSIKERIAGGEGFDVAILTTDALDELARTGRIEGSSRAALGNSGIGIGVRAGSAKPQVDSADALKHVLLAVRSLTYAGDGASRPSITRMLDTFGIGDAMKPKTILEQGSVRAAARVLQGDADMIITLVSEIVPVPGLELAGPLPEEFQTYVSFAAAVGADTANAAEARALIAFLAGPAAGPVFSSKGIDRR